MNIKKFTSKKEFTLESGENLPEITIAYTTYGNLNDNKDNIIWVCHALTANSEVDDWWPHTVEKNKFLDPEKYFIICANILGSHYGTTGPLTMNPKTAKPWYKNFPIITVRDMVKCHKLLLEHLGIHKIKMLIGSSIGGFQCLEFAIMYPELIDNLTLIATSAQSQPWAIALNESQRMAIESDCTFGSDDDKAAMKGLAAARSIALLSYRGQIAYDKTQQDTDRENKLSDYRVSGYQKYQGQKLCNRFNVYSYYRLTQAIDSHDISRGRGTVESVLKQIKSRTCIIAIDSDILFPLSEHYILRDNIKNAEFHIINSDFAHDGFLVEHEKLNNIILKFIQND